MSYLNKTFILQTVPYINRGKGISCLIIQLPALWHIQKIIFFQKWILFSEKQLFQPINCRNYSILRPEVHNLYVFLKKKINIFLILCYLKSSLHPQNCLDPPLRNLTSFICLNNFSIKYVPINYKKLSGLFISAKNIPVLKDKIKIFNLFANKRSPAQNYKQKLRFV